MAIASPDLQRQEGRSVRKRVPRSSHAAWRPDPQRRDPVTILEEQETARIPELLPIRHGRMLATPFTFFRGAAAVMAADLASTGSSGLRVQACGDAHLLNFGLYATPERALVFDVNDFDETLPAPFEWDVKRLAASLVVAGRDNGFSDRDCELAARSSVTAYRLRMGTCAQLGYLDVWYNRLAVDDLAALIDTAHGRALGGKVLRKAQRSTNLGALNRLTEQVDGRPRIADAPPLVEHLPERAARVEAPEVVRRYRSSLASETRTLLSRYAVVDWARKVVGVGSVGTDDAIVLLLGASDRDPLFLQAKEAQASVLEPFAGRSQFRNQGQRAVAGQRLMQAASDIFLGWTRLEDRDYYVRQLRDMKASIPIEKLIPNELVEYGRACGATLASGHARASDAARIAGYLGTSDQFDRAIGSFAIAYADQNERDHEAFAAAVRSGRVAAEVGV